jgi:two-component system chemotaxis response regulator CheB
MTTKVLLVEDSPIALAILKRLIDSSTEAQVIGTASNGKDALELIPKLEPNLICTDLHMDGMDGLELTKQVMAKHPLPILVVSNSVQEDNPHNIFDLLQAGALDVFPKPVTGLASDYENVKKDLIDKIKVLSGVKVFTKKLPSNSATPNITAPFLGATGTIKAVAIGASTGGPQALEQIFTQLPSSFPVPIICIQHISPGFLQGLVDWFGSNCKLPVKIAESGDSPLPGTIYFAPELKQLELDLQGRFFCSNLPPVDGHCPSVTFAFKSMAKFYGAKLAGVLLTGMGIDGAAGMEEIYKAGGLTIAQDETSCVIFGMPREAIARKAVREILPVQEIGSFLVNRIV